MKNLLYALELLSMVSKRVSFDIYGPIEDENYWHKCQKKIEQMPDNVNVSYRGVLVPYDVQKVFGKYDFFLFPTFGENYGHVIAESLLAGTFVITSDQTPWIDLDIHDIGSVISNPDSNSYISCLNHRLGMTKVERLES